MNDLHVVRGGATPNDDPHKYLATTPATFPGYGRWAGFRTSLRGRYPR